MHRLVLELSGKEFEDSLKGSMFENMESLKILHAFKMAPGEIAGIASIQLKQPYLRLEDLFPMGGFRKMAPEFLRREKDGVLIYFIHLKATQPAELLKPEVMPYITTPFEFSEGKLRLAFVGTSRQLSYLQKHDKTPLLVQAKVISLTDARVPPESPLAPLTERQRKVLITAYKLGYYDVPRRISSKDLAQRLDLVKSTFSAHIRKAEGRLKQILSEY